MEIGPFVSSGCDENVYILKLQSKVLGVLILDVENEKSHKVCKLLLLFKLEHITSIN